MKIADLRKKKTADLEKLVIDMKKELFNLRFQKTTGQLKNAARIKEVRRTVARAKTLITGQAREVAAKSKKA